MNKDLARLKRESSNKIRGVTRIPTSREGKDGDFLVLESSVGQQLLLKFKNKWFKLGMTPVLEKDSFVVNTSIMTGNVGASGQTILSNKSKIQPGSVVGIKFEIRHAGNSAAITNDMWNIGSFQETVDIGDSHRVYYNDAKHAIELVYIGVSLKGKPYRALIFYKG